MPTQLRSQIARHGPSATAVPAANPGASIGFMLLAIVLVSRTITAACALQPPGQR